MEDVWGSLFNKVECNCFVMYLRSLMKKLFYYNLVGIYFLLEKGSFFSWKL